MDSAGVRRNSSPVGRASPAMTLPFLFTKSTLGGSGVELVVENFVKAFLLGKVVKLLVPGFRP